MKYLLIGYGSIGKRHESIIKRYDIHSDITVCTRTKPAGIEYKWIKRQDLEKLDGEVFDLGIVATPTICHLDDIETIKNNCDKILVEKPLLSFEKELDKYQLLNKRDDCNIYVGYNMKHYSIVKSVISKTKQLRKLGKYFVYSSHCFSHIAQWRGSLEASAVSIDRDIDGGILNELSHELDILATSTGYDMNKRINVSEYCTKLIKKPEIIERIAADRASIYIEGTDYIANIDLSFSSHHDSRKIRIEDEENTFVYNLLTGIECHYRYNKLVYIHQHLHERDNTFLEQLGAVMEGSEVKGLTTLKEALKLHEWIKN